MLLINTLPSGKTNQLHIGHPWNPVPHFPGHRNNINISPIRPELLRNGHNHCPGHYSTTTDLFPMRHTYNHNYFYHIVSSTLNTWTVTIQCIIRKICTVPKWTLSPINNKFPFMTQIHEIRQQRPFSIIPWDNTSSSTIPIIPLDNQNPSNTQNKMSHYFCLRLSISNNFMTSSLSSSVHTKDYTWCTNPPERHRDYSVDHIFPSYTPSR